MNELVIRIQCYHSMRIKQRRAQASQPVGGLDGSADQNVGDLQNRGSGLEFILSQGAKLGLDQSYHTHLYQSSSIKSAASPHK